MPDTIAFRYSVATHPKDVRVGPARMAVAYLLRGLILPVVVPFAVLGFVGTTLYLSWLGGRTMAIVFWRRWLKWEA